MVNYGSVDYWNDRYRNDTGTAFDWLFDFKDVEEILDTLIPEKNLPILIPGCGNAPFSGDLYFKGQYHHLINMDLSDEAIKQMKETFVDVPGLEFHLMDVLNMPFEDESFPYIIDKSLVDTLMCYANG